MAKEKESEIVKELRKIREDLSRKMAQDFKEKVLGKKTVA